MAGSPNSCLGGGHHSKKTDFYDNSHNAAAYNSQSALGGAAVNPVVAPGRGSPSPVPLPTPNCCTYFHPHSPKLTLEILSSSYSYAISVPSFIIQTTSAAQKIIPDRELFVISRALLTVPNVYHFRGHLTSINLPLRPYNFLTFF